MSDSGSIYFVVIMEVSKDLSDENEPYLITDSFSVPDGPELSWPTMEAEITLEDRPNGEYQIWFYVRSSWWREATMDGTEVESEDEILDFAVVKLDTVESDDGKEKS